MTPDDLVVSPWGARFRGRRFACSIGRSGLTDRKREGDGATPLGIHRIVGAMYRPDRLARSQVPDWAVPFGPHDLWSDDPRDVDYNLLTRQPHAFGHERLTRADPMYDLFLITDWNWPDAVPGRGSAIFVHTWRSPRRPTAGCVAFARADLLWIARHLRLHSRLIIRG